jgi:hypothetical protein
MSECCPSVPDQEWSAGRVVTDSVITCPHCGTARTERMPTDACLIAYDCSGCSVRLRPKPGDCCVFCSYGSVPCPPVQAGNCCS